MPEEELTLDKLLWAIPVFEYADRFNSRRSDVRIQVTPCNRIPFVIFEFYLGEEAEFNLERGMFGASINFKDKYKIFKNFRMISLDFLDEESNRKRAEDISRCFVNGPVSISETHLGRPNKYPNSPTSIYPHLEHRYSTGEDEEDVDLFLGSYLSTLTEGLRDFNNNHLESDLDRFLEAVKEYDLHL